MKQLGQMLCLNQNCIQIRIRQSYQEFNLVWITNACIRPILLSRFANDVILTIGRWHVHCGPEKFSVEA